MFNFEPRLGSHNWSWDPDFNNLESTLSENACIVKSQIIALYFFRIRKTFSLHIFMIKFEPFWDPRYGSGITIFTIRNQHYLRIFA